MIKAVIFDCFGVIYQSRLKIFFETHVPRNKKEKVVELIRACDRALITKTDFVQRAAELSGVSQAETETVLFNGFTIDNSVIHYIDELRKNYRTALLTNIGQNTFYMLEAQLEPHFDVIVASFRDGVAKPDPAAYQLVADKLKVASSECLFVDDNPERCRVAEAVEMRAVVFKEISQLKRELTQYLIPQSE